MASQESPAARAALELQRAKVAYQGVKFRSNQDPTKSDAKEKLETAQKNYDKVAAAFESQHHLSSPNTALVNVPDISSSDVPPGSQTQSFGDGTKRSEPPAGMEVDDDHRMQIDEHAEIDPSLLLQSAEFSIPAEPINKVESPERDVEQESNSVNETDDQAQNEALADPHKEMARLKELLQRLTKDKTTSAGTMKSLTKIALKMSGEGRISADKAVDEAKKHLTSVESEIVKIKEEIIFQKERIASDKKAGKTTKAGQDDNEGKASFTADNWDNLSDEEKEEFQERARKALRRYLKSGDAKDFSVTYRRATLLIPEFLPEGATTSRLVAKMIHTNSSRNTLCRFHIKEKKYPHDGFQPRGPHIIHGAAYPCDASGTIEDPHDPEPGHMHCGCHVDDVLLEFFLWKTIKIFSHHPDLDAITEGVGYEIIHPRKRAIMVQLFRLYSRLTLADLYTGSGPQIDDPNYESGLWKLQAKRAAQMLQNRGVAVTFKVGTEAEAEPEKDVTDDDVDEGSSE